MGCWVEGQRGGIVKELGIDRYTLLYLRWTTNRDLLYSTGSSAQSYMAAWMGGKFGEMDTCICVAESLCSPPETITTLIVSCTPIQRNKCFKQINIEINMEWA